MKHWQTPSAAFRPAFARGSERPGAASPSLKSASWKPPCAIPIGARPPWRPLLPGWCRRSRRGSRPGLAGPGQLRSVHSLLGSAAFHQRRIAEPLLRTGEQLSEQRFAAAGLRHVAVLPAHQRRQRHQDRFSTAVGLQTEDRATVKNEIELHVAPAAVELELPLPLAVGQATALLHDRGVAGQEGIAAGSRQAEQLLPAVVEGPLGRAGGGGRAG